MCGIHLLLLWKTQPMQGNRHYCGSAIGWRVDLKMSQIGQRDVSGHGCRGVEVHCILLLLSIK
jgi:hypothetical protein